MKPLTAWSPGFSRPKPFEPPEGGTPNQPRFMESPLSFLRMHWDHEPRTSETAPPRCCRHLAGSAYLRLLCRQDAGSTLGFMESEAFLVGRGRTRRSWLLLAFVGATLWAGEPESAKTASVGARSIPDDWAFQPLNRPSVPDAP